VIEPLRALIDCQVKQLSQKGVNVETLLTGEDAIRHHKHGAAARLKELAEQNIQEPLILFSTPELIMTSGCFDGVCLLVAKGLLSLIVVDEFDCIDESNDVFRKSYIDLVPKLKNVTRDTTIPFLFLSATASTILIDILARPVTCHRPRLFLSKRALPPMHVYSGESSIL
jgi:superfamily II DNA helicase RecQ